MTGHGIDPNGAPDAALTDSELVDLVVEEGDQQALLIDELADALEALVRSRDAGFPLNYPDGHPMAIARAALAKAGRRAS